MSVIFELDGRLVREEDASPTTTLLEYLRRTRHETGTKEGCAEGDCGACTVVIADDDAPGGPTWRAVNACLLLLPLVHGRRVVTVAGLAREGRLHPAQQAMVDHLGSQCGYCTPGVVMSLVEATYRADLDAPWRLDDQLSGNLCRCTGYRPIRDAAAQVAGARPDDHLSRRLTEAPVEAPALHHAAQGQRFHAPTTLPELFALLASEPEARIVAGSTDLGLDVTRRHTRFPCLIGLDAIPELRQLTATSAGWRVGATVRVADLEAAMLDRVPAIARMLRYFGSRQIKNAATVGGNLCNASPIGDIAPTLLALDATAVIASADGERLVPMDAFFESYRRTALRPGEILAAVEIPSPAVDARVGAYKVSRRRELDISAVSACIAVRTDGATISSARVAFGGMAATPIRARAVEQALEGAPFTAESFARAAERVEGELSPISDHRASSWYRSRVAANLILGFFEEARNGSPAPLPDRPSGTTHGGVRP